MAGCTSVMPPISQQHWSQWMLWVQHTEDPNSDLESLLQASVLKKGVEVLETLGAGVYREIWSWEGLWRGWLGPGVLFLCLVSFLCKSILPSIALQNILCECVCGMWMQVTHVCMCMSTCKSSCALSGGKRLLSGVFLKGFPYLLRKGLSLNLEFSNLSNLVSSLGESSTSAELLRLLPSLHDFYVRWGLQTGLYDVRTSYCPRLFFQPPSITHPLWLVCLQRGEAY